MYKIKKYGADIEEDKFFKKKKHSAYEYGQLVGRESEERFTQSYEHHTGVVVKYKGHEYIVNKITKTGVYLQPIETNSDLLDENPKKPIFVEELEYSRHAIPIPTLSL